MVILRIKCHVLNKLAAFKHLIETLKIRILTSHVAWIILLICIRTNDWNISFWRNIMGWKSKNTMVKLRSFIYTFDSFIIRGQSSINFKVEKQKQKICWTRLWQSVVSVRSMTQWNNCDKICKCYHKTWAIKRQFRVWDGSWSLPTHEQS